MERRIMKVFKNTALAGALFALISIAVGCENSVNLLSKIETEVMKSNDRYLKIASIYIPLENNTFSPSGTIEVVFDRPIDPSSLSNDTLLVQTSGGDKQTYDMSRVTYIASSNTVRIQFYPYLPVNRDMQITVSGIQGTDGTKLLETMSKSFKTQAILLIEPSSFKGSSSFEENYSNNSNFLFSFKVNDFKSFYRFKISADGGNNWIPSELFDRASTKGIHSDVAIDLSTQFGISDEGSYTLQLLIEGSDANSTSNLIPGNELTLIARIDKTAPEAGVFYLKDSKGNTSFTGEKQPTLIFTTKPTDPNDSTGTAVREIRFSNDGTIWDTWKAISLIENALTWDIYAGFGASSSSGTKTVYAQVRDKAGNESAPISASILFDEEPPLAGAWAVNNGASKVYIAEITISQTTAPTDALTDVQFISFSNDGSTWSAWESLVSTKSWNSVTSSGGKAAPEVEESRNIFVRVQDTAGNVSAVFTSAPFTFVNAPPSSVSIPKLLPEDDTGESNTDNITKNAVLRFSGTADPNTTVFLYKGTLADSTNAVEMSTVTSSATGTWTLSTTALSDGTHTFFTQAVDGPNKTNSAGEVSVIVDTTPPNPPTLSAPSGIITQRKPSISWLSGAGGNGKYTYQLNNDQETPSTKTSFPVGTDLSNGTYSFSIKEADTAGNISQAASTTFTVNAIPKKPKFDELESATLENSFTWTWTSGGFGNGTYRYQLNSTTGSWKEVSDKSITLTSLLDGANTLYLQEKDDQGNWSSSASKQVIISPVLPYNGQPFSSAPLGTWVRLQWRPAARTLSGYTIQKKDRLGWVDEGETINAVQEFIWNNLTDGTYTWRIKYNDSRKGDKFIPSIAGATFTIEEEKKDNPIVPPKGLPKL